MSQTLRIALCQHNPTIGDYNGNLKKILDLLELAKRGGAQLAVFPELATCGYPPRDLLEQEEFVSRHEAMLESIEATCDGIGALVGFVRRRHERSGRQLANSAVLLAKGTARQIVDKTLLPAYDVFDENRYFEPASTNKPIEFAGLKLGVTICEDLWNVEGLESRDGTPFYGRDLAAELQRQGCDLLLNISASPFADGKPQLRRQLFGGAAARTKLPLFFVNQVGANDDLIFDGGSFAVDAAGKLCASAHRFEEDLLFCDLEKHKSWQLVDGTRAKEADAVSNVINALTLGIRDYFRKLGLRDAVIGMSGGVDSALVAALAVRALGPSHVVGVMMPTRFTSEVSRRDAAAVATNLGIKLETISIENLFEMFQRELKPLFGNKKWDTTEENLQSRLRGTMLMAYSNKFGNLVLSTGNKSELAVGYCTLYGDLNGGLAVLSDVFKTDVYKLCAAINNGKIAPFAIPVIPESVIKRAPSAELRDNQTDQETLPPYELLDAILRLYIDERLGLEAIVAQLGERPIVERILQMVDRNEFKRRQAPTGLKVSVRAFGQGRRLPIVQRFH